jgi:GNAT superfamily N-acetyltransferase
MIRQCRDTEFDLIHAIVNDAALAYKGVIPADCWKEPYMPEEELRHEIDQGVVFWGEEEAAYVRTTKRNQGIGGRLLSFLQGQTRRPILVGTWADAVWAVRFYEKRGFRLVSSEEKDRLLKKYWRIPQRQIETSVVLADQRWIERQKSR